MVYYVKRPCVQIFVLAYYKSIDIILNKHLMKYDDYIVFKVFLNDLQSCSIRLNESFFIGVHEKLN